MGVGSDPNPLFFSGGFRRSVMFLLIAQGPGFYGCAIQTTDVSLEEIRAKMNGLGLDPKDAKTKDGKVLGLYGGIGDNGLNVFTAPDGLQPQPIPVIVMDTGNGKKDLQLLKDLGL